MRAIEGLKRPLSASSSPEVPYKALKGSIRHKLAEGMPSCLGKGQREGQKDQGP